MSSRPTEYGVISVTFNNLDCGRAVKKQRTYDLTENLKSLVAAQDSVADAAKKLDINRQQLNKYLSGTTTPSLRILSHFSRVFGIPIDDFILSHGEFYKRHCLSAEDKGFPKEVTTKIDEVLYSAKAAAPNLKAYCGTYFRISKMPSMPHKMLRAVFYIYQHDGLTFGLAVEVFPTPGDPSGRKLFFRRQATLLHFWGDRIYTFDASQSTRFLFGILYPESLPGFEFLQGHSLGVSDFGSRQIFTAPYVLQRLGARRPALSDIRACGVIDRDDPDIPEEVFRRLALA